MLSIETEGDDDTIIIENLTVAKGASLNVNGDTSIKGNLNVLGNASVANGATLTIDYGAQLIVGGKVQGTLVNNGTISVYSDEQDPIPSEITGTGTIDTSAIQEDAQLGGTINSETGAQTVFSVGQIVTLVSDTKLVKDTVLKIKGTMIIPEGITLSIEDSAALIIEGSASKLVNNGTIIVESGGQEVTDIRGTDEVCLVLDGGVIENNGIINLDWETDSEEWYGQRYSMYVKSGTVKNAGTLTISEGNTLGIVRTSAGQATSIFSNLSDGTIISEGGIVGFIDNAGSISIDGFAWGTISLVAQDAQVQVISLTTNVGQPLVINDSGLKFGKDKVAGVGGVGINAVTLDATATDGKQTIGGTVISCNILAEKVGTTTDYSNQLFVNGEVDYTTTSTEGDVTGIGMILSGVGIVASEKFSIPEKVTLTIGQGSVFRITGESSIEGTVVTLETGKIMVTGKLVTPKPSLVTP